MKYYITEVGRSYWERMNALRKKTEKPRVITPLNISPEAMVRFFSQKSPRVNAPSLELKKQLNFKFMEEMKRTLLQRISAWIEPSGPRVRVPPKLSTKEFEEAYKRFKRTAGGGRP
jgi:hypothetical protein